ncbi:MAG TPA: 2-oxoglutarate dehydrogenase E1 component [Chitinophagales bacterium]|jgi:2-oxoglutarate dehydrogenase E1 component|nr:2-oxoglutarate dehydrogenase E1 component [Chitinophagales bacterium]MBP6155203.1 2-oxoglutarate dehydrogenase E1 component [Chitinophagales bacterium]HQV78000.1 2-oxoglutarate dehydrogenase E1 component [Chitinophagales bacterium]HQW78722.1 2-oxoglutarate dehydrogenase E1 component [Chitinophagales bacterium]
MEDLSILSNAHPSYIDALYQDYLKDQNSVDLEWKKFFAGFDLAYKYGENGAGNISTSESTATPTATTGFVSPKEFKVLKLISGYRNKGHLVAVTNPLRPRKDRHADLELHFFGLDESDLDIEFYAGKEIGIGKATLRTIIERLKKIYCRTIGWEYNYILDRDERAWMREQIEHGYIAYEHPIEKKKRILSKLNESEVLEKFLGTKYIGQKRFSLEGGESTIPALDSMINVAANHGVEEIVIGMAHRGRLNVLTNIVGKTYEDIFSEFDGIAPDDFSTGTGDVKYHLGFSGQYDTMDGKEVYVKLLPNPSHLEAINPVVQGYCRAKANAIYQEDYDKILPITIHGDAAVAGQGIVYEVLQMQSLKGYTVGGTIHFVINNQIGFTTDFDDARTSNYCTSIASTIQAPVFHVNGDDVECVTYVAELAAEYRQRFNKDIFVDMVCYRRWGHNEGDDPSYTQPQMYKIIKGHEGVRDLYQKKLYEWGMAEAEFAKKMEEEFWLELQARLNNYKQNPRKYIPQSTELAWNALRKSTDEDFQESPETNISKDDLVKIIKALIKIPEGFKPLKKINQYLEQRRVLMRENNSVDWAAAELMAYGSILLDGKDVRLSGEDVKRGTFSHRHACLYDEVTNEEYNRLNFIAEDGNQGKFRITNSHLSEYAVLGFEFGYSISSPSALTIWEAQFGDFNNGAQIIIDQFIASCETKWNRQSGLVLLLPHGYEGAGPEHSSARLERFLQMCGEHNMIVTNISSPANYFHAIRRQLAWPFRKPMINMSPKSLLRHPKCVDPISIVYEGKFREVIDDANTVEANGVKKVLFCTGKIYYDLLAKKEADNRTDVAIVRVEQLYPVADKQLDAIIKKYSKATYHWVQEEPINMGAYSFLLLNYNKAKYLQCIARPQAASPATGFSKLHEKEQKALVELAFS